MSTYIPTVEEYQSLSWHARQLVAKRIRKQLNDAARRERHKFDAELMSQAVRNEAELWYEAIEPDPPEVIAERRAVWGC